MGSSVSYVWVPHRKEKAGEHQLSSLPDSGHNATSFSSSWCRDFTMMDSSLEPAPPPISHFVQVL